MSCGITKCKGEGCTVSLPNCQLRQGLCPTCVNKKKNVPNPTPPKQ